MSEPHVSARKVGSLIEDAACSHLRSLGYDIVERNYRCRFGEIDIIAWEKGTLVFIEVRYRGLTAIESPAESLTRRKFGRIKKSVRDYLFCRAVSDNTPVRVDACLASPARAASLNLRDTEVSFVSELGAVRFEVIQGAIEFC